MPCTNLLHDHTICIMYHVLCTVCLLHDAELYDTLYSTVPYYDILCYMTTKLHYAMPCCVVPHCTAHCFTVAITTKTTMQVPWVALLYSTLLYYAMLRHSILSHVMSCYGMRS